MLALDDLHWADAASMELIVNLLRRPPDGRSVHASRSGMTMRILGTACSWASGRSLDQQWSRVPPAVRHLVQLVAVEWRALLTDDDATA